MRENARLAGAAGEVPEIVTQGATVEEARSMVRSALRDWLELYVRDQAGEP